MTNSEIELLGKITEIGMTVSELRAENKVLKDVNEKLMDLLRIKSVNPLCKGNCGMNYCDDNCCIERKRELVEISDSPVIKE